MEKTTEEKVQDFRNRRQWFLDRLGKTVYRNQSTCDCEICKSVYEKGLFLSDSMQAIYAFDIECDFNAEGKTLKFFDTIEERDQFEKSLAK